MFVATVCPPMLLVRKGCVAAPDDAPRLARSAARGAGRVDDERLRSRRLFEVERARESGFVGSAPEARLNVAAVERLIRDDAYVVRQRLPPDHASHLTTGNRWREARQRRRAGTGNH